MTAITRLAPLSFTPAVAHGPIGPCAKTAAQLCVAADVALVYARATQLNTKAFDEHFRRGGSSNLDERADVKAPRTFEKLLGSYPADVQALASAARQWLRKWLPRVEETVDSSVPVIGYGYGPGYRGMVCTLILSKSGVKLGLVRGGELEDPRGLLEGTGKVHRYIQLRTVSDLRKAGVSQLVKAAYTAWQERR